uniref:Uncharacterized protein n=1 Tax=Periophthalmus magnuspinnatus TaxID=409849 RepID=A0A3B4BBZ4_9GOBI
MGLFARIRKEWFIIGIVLVILSAKVHPSFGVRGGESPGDASGASVVLIYLFMFLFKRQNATLLTLQKLMI